MKTTVYLNMSKFKTKLFERVDYWVFKEDTHGMNRHDFTFIIVYKNAFDLVDTYNQSISRFIVQLDDVSYAIAMLEDTLYVTKKNFGDDRILDHSDIELEYPHE